MIKVKSSFTINQSRIRELNLAKITALEQTAEALHTEVVQEQVIPRDTGALQNENTFVDKQNSSSGIVSVVSSTLYARRLYYHPEYNFHRGVWFDAYGERHEGNAAAGGLWFTPWLPGGTKQDFIPKKFRILYRRIARLRRS